MDPDTHRPEVSVCLATYNGERFLRRQMDSVLTQLGRHDELVVTDDGSTDSTLQIVESYRDPRVKLLPFVQRLGSTRAFERSIAYATGEYIFLCDQDDVWFPDKIAVSVQMLQDRDVLAVVSDARVIDADGETLIESYQSWRGSREGFWANWAKNGFLGCCMAFRGSAKQILLPFPATINMHDEWIGLCCATAGLVRFTPRQLIAYRRHGGNVTGMRHRSVPFMVMKRLGFLVAIAGRLPKILRNRRTVAA
jgi:glycosyltransferase involved in cell wall biosynthesis